MLEYHFRATLKTTSIPKPPFRNHHVTTTLQSLQSHSKTTSKPPQNHLETNGGVPPQVRRIFRVKGLHRDVREAHGRPSLAAGGFERRHWGLLAGGGQRSRPCGEPSSAGGRTFRLGCWSALPWNPPVPLQTPPSYPPVRFGSPLLANP